MNHPEAAAARRNQILDIMHDHGRVQIGEDTFFTPTDEEIRRRRRSRSTIAEKRFPIEAPHFVLQYVQPQLERLLRRATPSSATAWSSRRRWTSTCSTRSSEIMEERSPRRIRASSDYEEISNSHNGSMMVIDPKTGEILVMIGSRDYFREDIEGKNNNATACNSPGRPSSRSPT